jgi:sperm-associated antigen 16 protein
VLPDLLTSTALRQNTGMAEDDGFNYGTVPDLEPEVGGGDEDDDDIALLVQSMMKGPAVASSAGSGAAVAQQMPGGHPGAAGPQAISSSLPTVADDFIRNFLIRCGMRRSLDAFNTEWYELKAKGMLPDDETSIGGPGGMMAVPDIYAQHERLSDAVARLRLELAHAQEVATKAQSQWEKLRRERDFHRMHHKRVAQEKNRLIGDMKRLKAHFESFDPTLKELRARYEGAMRDKMLLKVERDKLAAKVNGLEAQVQALEERQQGGGGGAVVESTPSPAVAGGAAKKGASRTTSRGPAARGAAGQGGTRRSVSPPQGGTRKGGALGKSGGGYATKAADNHASASDPLPEDMPNPYSGLAFEPAHASSYAAASTIRAHGAAVTGVAFHPTKPVLASVSDDCTWRLWSMPEGELIMTGEGHRAWCADVDFHPYGNHLATSSGDGVVKVWSLGDATCAATLSDHTQTVWSVAWHASGDFLLTASMDHTCRLFDLGSGGASTGRVRQTLRGHVDSVNSVVWQPYSFIAATASGDKTVSLWDTRTALCVQTFYGHGNAVNDVCFNLQGDTLVSCDSDGYVKVFDIRMVVERASAYVGGGAGGSNKASAAANAVSLDRSGACISVACEDGTVRILDASQLVSGVGVPTVGGPPLNLKTLLALRGHEDAAQAVSFDPTSSYLVSGGSDATIRCWSDGGEMPDLKGAGVVTSPPSSP